MTAAALQAGLDHYATYVSHSEEYTYYCWQENYLRNSFYAACIEGFFGDRCEDLCQCRNISECDFITGSCACQAGFTGSTCHDLCPDGSYGLECGLTCQCLTRGTRSCDHITGSCDCQDMWVGDLCDIQGEG